MDRNNVEMAELVKTLSKTSTGTAALLQTLPSKPGGSSPAARPASAAGGSHTDLPLEAARKLIQVLQFGF